MSVIEGTAEVKYSLRVFRLLTLVGPPDSEFAVLHNGAQTRRDNSKVSLYDDWRAGAFVAAHVAFRFWRSP